MDTAGTKAYVSGRECCVVPEGGITTGGLLSPGLSLVGKLKQTDSSPVERGQGSGRAGVMIDVV